LKHRGTQKPLQNEDRTRKHPKKGGKRRPPEPCENKTRQFAGEKRKSSAKGKNSRKKGPFKEGEEETKVSGPRKDLRQRDGKKKNKSLNGAVGVRQRGDSKKHSEKKVVRRSAHVFEKKWKGESTDRRAAA